MREKSAVNYVKSYLGIKPIFVIDPTLLIDKKYYLNIIKDYKQNSLIKEEKYIFTYLFGRQKNIQKFIKYASKKLGYKIYAVRQRDNNSIKKFIYGIANSNAVITNSFHGTVFSIMFKKPFITFFLKNSPRERFISLKNLLLIKGRFFKYNQKPDVKLLTTPLQIDIQFLNLLRNKSINYLKNNLGIIKKK